MWVVGNYFVRGGTALKATGSTGKLTFSDNIVGYVQYSGLYTVGSGALNNAIISNNIFSNVGIAGDATFNSGINLVTGLYNIISGNRMLDEQTTKTMKYGIRLHSGVNNNLITGNYVTDAVTANYLDEGTGNKFSGNFWQL